MPVKRRIRMPRIGHPDSSLEPRASSVRDVLNNSNSRVLQGRSFQMA